MKFRKPSIRFRKVVRSLKGEGPNARVEVLDQQACSGRPQAIPRRVFQAAKTRSVHPRHNRSLQAFRAHNRDLDFVLFNDDDCQTYMDEHWGDHPIHRVFKSALFPQMKADIFRYCIVFENGGYWVDFNKGFRGSITGLHGAESTGMISFESNPSMIFPRQEAASLVADPVHLAIQWAFGFQQKHPILGLAIERIVEIEPFFRSRTFVLPKNAILTMTGPGLFTSALRDMAEKRGLAGVTQLSTDFDGQGVFRLDGWNLSIDRGNHYARLRDKQII